MRLMHMRLFAGQREWPSGYDWLQTITMNENAQWQMIKDSVLFALSSGFSVSLFHYYLKNKSTRGVLFCISSFFLVASITCLLLAYCLYWRQFRSLDLSFNLFPVGSSLGHVICLLIYFRLAAMLLNILKCISMFILLPLTLHSGAYQLAQVK